MERNALGGLLLHQLLLRLFGEMVEFEADLRRRDRLAFGGEIADDLVEDALVAPWLELGSEHLFAVSLGIGASQPHFLRRP